MRSLLALVLLLVGGLMVPVATAGWWLRDTVVPADAYVRTVAPLASNDDIQAAVRATLVAEAGAAVEDAPAPLRQRLEPVLRRAAAAVVESPAFAQAWRDANRAAHRQLVGALAGDTESVDVRDGSTVVLRLDALSEAIREEVAGAGLGLDVAIPGVEATYPVGDVEDLGQARTAYNIFEDYGRLLPFLAGLLVLLGLAAAHRRALALSGTALVSLVGTGLVWVALGLARSRYVDALPGAVPEDAGRAYYNVLTSDLRTALLYVAVGSAVVMVLGVGAALLTDRRA